PIGLANVPIPDPMTVPDLKHSVSMLTINLKSVTVHGLSKFQIIRAEFEIALMQNLGFLESVFQGAMNSLGSFIFNNIKPFILNEVNTNIRGEVNKKISKLPYYFPNSISPFDMAIAEARKQVSDLGYDPYKLKDYSQNSGLITVVSSNTWLTGLSSFYRMGNITLTMENGTVNAVIDVGTQEIDGRTHWEVGLINGFLSRAGTISFTVQYLRMQMKLIQPVDTRKQEINKIDVEKLISENIPIVEKQVLIKGIKLSEAIILAEIALPLSEDENLKIVDSEESSFHN
ncbi:hypothetical protein G9C98_002434, partial [Cotesia typhae]